MDIIHLIRQYNLIYLTPAKLSETIATITHEAVVDVKNEVNNLIHDGILFLDDNNKISISADKGYLKAKICLNKKGYGFAQVEGYKDFFIPAFAINSAFDGDDCLVQITDRNGEDVEAKVVKVLKRNTTRVVGTYIEGKNKNVVFPDDEKLPQIRIYKNDSKNAKNNEKVWVEINL